MRAGISWTGPSTYINTKHPENKVESDPRTLMKNCRWISEVWSEACSCKGKFYDNWQDQTTMKFLWHKKIMTMSLILFISLFTHGVIGSITIIHQIKVKVNFKSVQFFLYNLERWFNKFQINVQQNSSSKGLTVHRPPLRLWKTSHFRW